MYIYIYIYGYRYVFMYIHSEVNVHLCMYLTKFYSYAPIPTVRSRYCPQAEKMLISFTCKPRTQDESIKYIRFLGIGISFSSSNSRAVTETVAVPVPVAVAVAIAVVGIVVVVVVGSNSCRMHRPESPTLTP